MITKLGEYNYRLEYIPGKTNHVVNALSWLIIAKKTMKTIIIVGRPKKHGKKDYKDDRVILKKGREIFSWIQSRWENILQPNCNYKIHKKYRVKAKRG